MPQFLFIPLIVLGAVALLLLSIGFYLSEKVIHPDRFHPDQLLFSWTPMDVGLPYEPVSFQTTGGLTLRGWLFRTQTKRYDPERFVIIAGGYRTNKSNMLGISGHLWRLGYSVLAFDFRGQGESDREPVLTLGHREVDDLLAAVNYLTGRFGKVPLAVLGFSMGAAVSILAAARDKRITAVIADSPFASHEQVLSHSVRRTLRIYSPFILKAGDLFFALRAGFRLGEVAPEREVAKIAPRPLLLIHGTADDICPFEGSKRIYENAGEPKQLWALPELSHCAAYFTDRRAYVERIDRFLDKALSGDASKSHQFAA